MTLEELDHIIVSQFRHLVIIRNRTFFELSASLACNFGPDAAILATGDQWFFDCGKRWTECASDEFPLIGAGFRFRDLDDAILFKLRCG